MRPGWYLFQSPRVDTEFERVLHVAAGLWNVPASQILGRARSEKVCAPRHAVCALLYKRGHKLTKIGRFLGRDHATVSHGVEASALRSLTDRRHKTLCRELDMMSQGRSF